MNASPSHVVPSPAPPTAESSATPGRRRVVFDLWGTLVHGLPFCPAVRVSQDWKTDLAAQSIVDVLLTTPAHDINDYFAACTSALRLTPTVTRFNALQRWVDAERRAARASPTLSNILAEAEALDVQLDLASNLWPLALPTIAALVPQGRIAKAHLSFTLRCAKPSVAFWRPVLASSSVSSVVVIGDSMRLDIQPVRDLGYAAVPVDGTDVTGASLMDAWRAAKDLLPCLSS